jgi:hypothetical protein
VSRQTSSSAVGHSPGLGPSSATARPGAPSRRPWSALDISCRRRAHRASRKPTTRTATPGSTGGQDEVPAWHKELGDRLPQRDVHLGRGPWGAGLPAVGPQDPQAINSPASRHLRFETPTLAHEDRIDAADLHSGEVQHAVERAWDRSNHGDDWLRGNEPGQPARDPARARAARGQRCEHPVDRAHLGL